jgi:hypothetical protein
LNAAIGLALGGSDELEVGWSVVLLLSPDKDWIFYC